MTGSRTTQPEAGGLVRDVAVLYVDPLGIYPKLVEHWYDEARDAKKYPGPFPVVAHPPCGPWGPLRHLNVKQDATCGPSAVAMVRRFGGVLEQPAGSKLWEHCGIPHPDLSEFDRHGGWSIVVNQVAWGHVARKPTWLYFVGIPTGIVAPGIRSGGTVTHWCSGFRSSTGRNPKHYRQNGSAVPPGIKVCSAQQRRRTPVAFAKWLLELAQSVRGVSRVV